MAHKMMKQAIFTFFERVFTHDELKSMLVDSLKSPFLHQIERFGDLPLFTETPYAELGRASRSQTIAGRDDIIVISGRFRSGSTLLWNIFRTIPGLTAYYEPFNENQWFNPHVTKKAVDATHKNVEHYYTEYQSLEVLSEYYREEWIRKNLYMEPFFSDPAMKKFLCQLIENAPARPVLQFNRIDFRLPWIRHHFPNATVIHIYRHPRDQWCSTLREISSFPHTATMEQFAAHDKFYLRAWGQDLKYVFPFLDEALISHPYELFYYLWKLSFLFGTAYADYSVCFEHLIERPSAILSALFETCRIPEEHIPEAERLIAPPHIGKWKQYADGSWFSRREAACETILQDFIRSHKALQAD